MKSKSEKRGNITLISLGMIDAHEFICQVSLDVAFLASIGATLHKPFRSFSASHWFLCEMTAIDFSSGASFPICFDSQKELLS